MHNLVQIKDVYSPAQIQEAGFNTKVLASHQRVSCSNCDYHVVALTSSIREAYDIVCPKCGTVYKHVPRKHTVLKPLVEENLKDLITEELNSFIEGFYGDTKEYESRAKLADNIIEYLKNKVLQDSKEIER